jgi:hypothetical protein
MKFWLGIYINFEGNLGLNGQNKGLGKIAGQTVNVDCG